VKANYPLLVAVLLLCSCVAPSKPAPLPPVVAAPIPRPVAVVPPPLPKPPADWRDAAQTPGEWRWSAVNGRSTASFVQPGGAVVASLACNRTGAQVLLSRAGPGGEAHQPLAVTTTHGTRPLLSEPLLSAPGWLTAELRSVDPILDGIAFSRGRFALEALGQPPLYLPAWAELSRVVEDCR
jgi:hypothetical protein